MSCCEKKLRRRFRHNFLANLGEAAESKKPCSSSKEVKVGGSEGGVRALELFGDTFRRSPGLLVLARFKSRPSLVEGASPADNVRWW